jgi:glyoxylase-like metal-dependent hydrolase (beta-lactamase superfamily II)
MVAGAKSEEVKLPIPFYLIGHPQGIVLFDSGLALEFPEQVNAWWLHRWMQKLLPYEFLTEDSAVEQLKKRGISPEQVRFIILSHLHYDHSSGVQDFPNARIVISKKEWESSKVGRWRALMRGIMLQALKGIEDRLLLIDYASGSPWGPFESSYDLFGDGSLILLSTPGHTPGSQSLLVTLGSGKKVLLTGDAVWVRENYLWPSPKSWFIRHFEEKAKQSWDTTLRIKKYHDENPDTFIFPGHDPHLWGELPSEFQ